MSPTLALVIGVAVGVLVTAGVALVMAKSAIASRLAQREVAERDEANNVLAKARAEAEQIAKQSRQQADEQAETKLKNAEREIAKQRFDVEKLERKLESKEEALDRKLQGAEKRERELEQQVSGLDKQRQGLEAQKQEIQQLRTQASRRCEEISGLTAEQAKKVLLELMETEVRSDAAAMVKRIETETKEVANKKARQIITLAIQKCATDQVGETTVSVVNLPNDEMKGRIIGREGRNIRALEATTGCNIIVDDTPEAIVLSCFDPMRREVARMAIERLLGDGRIHPGRIEEVVEKVQKDLADHIREVGEQAVFDLGINDMHPELIKTLGRLKYRTSYGQNILMHSSEVARLCSHLAAELGADVQAAKRAGLLHDIGKALSYEMEGTHALIGAELARKCNETPGVVHAIAAHHNEEDPRTIIAVLVQAADAISSSRPGSRRESLENYVKRMEKLEAIADSFNGVTKAYAIQAGRELRIMVEPTEINDNEAALLAREITKKIEQDLEYPGQIKVTVCREIRAVEYAK